MISMQELLHGAKLEDQKIDIQSNLTTLLQRINQVRNAWAKPMTVTSGLRTREDHIRIYKEIAEKKGIPFDETKIPWGSQHLTGGAVDIYDPKLELTAWLKANPKILEDAGLWCEEGNANWVHFQIHPPKSGNRWFYP